MGAMITERRLADAFTGCSMAGPYDVPMLFPVRLPTPFLRLMFPLVGMLAILASAVPGVGHADGGPGRGGGGFRGEGGRGDPGGPPSMRFRSDQDQARRALLDGDVMPFSVIKRRVEQQIGGDADYLGSEFIPERNAYRLKYMRDRNVMWVDVDGRTGAITGWAH